MQTDINLYAGHATPKNIVLRALPTVVAVTTTIWLYAGHATPNNIIMSDPTVIRGAGPVFPTQYSGFRYWDGTMRELCVVAESDAPSGMGARVHFRGSAADYALYLVETSDPNASPLMLRTTTGTKAIRLKT
jgi:hypothetical protein